MIKEFPAPRINTNDDQLQISHWHVKESEMIELGDPIVDIETSKANVTIESEFSGYIFNLVKKGEIVSVGESLCSVADSLDEIEGHKKIMGKKLAKNILPDIDDVNTTPLNNSKNFDIKLLEAAFNTVRFSNRAKTLIEELNLDPNSFANLGLITSKFILKGSSNNNIEKNITIHEVNEEIGKKKRVRSGPITPREVHVSVAKREEISQLVIGEAGLINSMLSVTFDSNEMRSKVKHKGILKGSIQSVILYQISQLLPKWPQFTSYFENNEIHFYDRVDLGLAIDLGMGLKVVRIKDAELESTESIEKLTMDFCLRYMRKQLKAEELVGSTITVTDLSSLDILYFHPLINGHQSAIIGIGADSSISGHPTSICMTFDHRISTGREVATFLKELKNKIIEHFDNINEDLPLMPR